MCERRYTMAECREEWVIGCARQMPTVTPFQEDGKLPDGEGDVERDVLQLASRALGITRHQLRARGKSWQRGNAPGAIIEFWSGIAGFLPEGEEIAEVCKRIAQS